MAYNITVNLLPAGSSFYVSADASNPTTIDSTATLRFYADGTYYIMDSAPATAVSVVGADVVSWTRTSTQKAILIINNPTQDVTITITAKQVLAPLDYNKPFNITAKAPIDTRIVLTKAQMAAIMDAKMPDYYFCICKDDNAVYIYDKTNDADATLGKFRSVDNYLTFTSDAAKANFNAAVANSSKIGDLSDKIASAATKIATLTSNVSDLGDKVDVAQEDIEVIHTWIENVKLDGGEIKAYYPLTATYTNVTPDVTPTRVEYNKDLTITFTANDGYELPSIVTVNGVEVGAVQIDCGVLQAQWIKLTGKLSLIQTVGDVSYTVTGVAK